MATIKILQFNADRGKAAMLLAVKEFSDKFDIAIIQEPYLRYTDNGDFDIHSQGEDAKAQIWTKKALEAKTIQEQTDKNYVTIKCAKLGNVYITSIYDEPGGRENRRLMEWNRTRRETRVKEIVAGDFNAHSEAWGEDGVDQRGEDLLTWINDNRYNIANDKRLGPTFVSRRGRSNVDITLNKGIVLKNWRIGDETTLSGHKYIIYEFETVPQKAQVRKTYDFDRTNWDLFKAKLERDKDKLKGEDSGIEARAVRLQEVCKEACLEQIRTKQVVAGGDNEWWTPKLQRLKTITNNLRRWWQRTRLEEDLDVYREQRNEYKKEIVRAKEAFIDEKIQSTFDDQPWDRAWKIAAGKPVIKPPTNLKKDDGTYTDNDKEAHQYLISKYFPQDEPENDTVNMKAIRQDQMEYEDGHEDEICREEIEETVKSLKRKKATSTDRIPNEAMPYIFEVLGDEITSLYSECWNRGVFPRVWKVAGIVWVPKKDGKPRPISLLPTLGKVLDKMINKRLQNHLERSENISKRQYAYRQGTGTVDALKSLVEVIETNKNSGLHQLVIALDLSNAFNSAWRPYISRQLKKCQVGKRLGAMCEDFLRDRTVTSGEITEHITKGCPQGSSLGPTLWNVIMQGWFQTVEEENLRWRNEMAEARDMAVRWVEELAVTQAYADDQIVVVSGTSVKSIETKWQRVWHACKAWEANSNTKYNADKTEMLFIEGGRKRIRPPVIRLEEGGKAVEINEKLKYLGVYVDRTLNFTEHLKHVRSKVLTISNKLINVAKRTLGKKDVFMKLVADKIIKPAVLYGCEVWGRKAGLSSNKKILNVAQRPVLLATLHCYRTTATTAVQVLTGTMPWWLEAETNWETYNTHKEDIKKEKIRAKDKLSVARMATLQKTATCRRENHITIAVDASQRQFTGIGICRKDRDREETVELMIREKINTDKAEILAVLLAIQREEMTETDITVLTDRKDAIKRLAEGKLRTNIEVSIWREIEKRWENGFITRIKWMRREDESIQTADRASKRAANGNGAWADARQWTYITKADRKRLRLELARRKWQREWEEEKTGRILFNSCKEVGFDHLRTSFKANQLLTGHGNMLAYLKRFRLRQTDGTCDCGQGQEDDEHIKRQCIRQDRLEARQTILDRHGNLDITLRRDGTANAEQIAKVNTWAGMVISDDDFARTRDDEHDEDEE